MSLLRKHSSTSCDSSGLYPWNRMREGLGWKMGSSMGTWQLVLELLSLKLYASTICTWPARGRRQNTHTSTSSKEEGGTQKEEGGEKEGRDALPVTASEKVEVISAVFILRALANALGVLCHKEGKHIQG